MWWEVTIRIGAETAEDLAGELAFSSEGAELTPAEGGVLLSIVTAARPEAERTARAAEEALRGRGIDPRDHPVEIREIADGRWVEAYQTRLKPFPAGERFLVIPGSERPDGGDRIPILLVPGRAFGTGEHPTTRMCVEELERVVRPSATWFDLGTGTGILAMVAVSCGAATVRAADVDPDAVEVAREVIRANGFGDRVDLFLGSAEDVEPHSVDGIVANIAAPYFLSHAGDLRRILRKGGLLLATGFLREDVPEVGTELQRCGLAVTRERSREEWALLVAAAGRGADESA